MRNLFIPVLFIVLLACKKEKNWEYWDNLAVKKMDEIYNLSKNYTCSDISNLTFQQLPSYCPYSIIVHKNDIQQFNKLVKEYQDYSKKAHNAGKPIPYYDMCAANFAIKIACNDNKPHLITSLNIELEDINIEMPKLYDEIINHYIDTPCSNVNDWQGVILYNGENKEAIAIKNTDNSFYQKISLYNQLNSRKLIFENKQFPQIPNKKIILNCENSRIKAEFE